MKADIVLNWLMFIVALAASFAAIASWKTMNDNKILQDNQGKVNTLNNIATIVFSEKLNYFSSLEALYRWKEEERNEEWQYAFTGTIRTYLNTYEYACKIYQTEHIDKVRFKEMFKDEVIKIYTEDFGANWNLSVKDEKGDTFSGIRDVAKEFLKDK
jgi:hypothetical protein